MDGNWQLKICWYYSQQKMECSMAVSYDYEHRVKMK